MAKPRALTRAQKKLELGHWQEARDLLEQAVTAPTTQEALAEINLELGQLYLTLNQPEQAVVALSRVVGDLPDHAQAHYMLGLAYQACEQWDKASAVLERADQLAPNDPAILSLWGWMMYQSGRRRDGKKMVERALQMNLVRFRTLLDLAMIYAAEEDLPAAISCAHRAHQLDPDNAEVRDMLNMLYALKVHLETQGMIVSDTRLPRTEKEWRKQVSVALRPFDIIEKMTAQKEPQSQEELQVLADKVSQWWNTTPRPELGGIAPDRASKLQHQASRVEFSLDLPWLGLDPRVAEANALRCDIVACLSHLRDMKYTATASRGNLPLKAVRAINEQLVSPAELDTKIGDRTYKMRSVQEVGKIDFLQTLVITGKFARLKAGHQIKLTKGGEEFLASAPIRQIALLLDAWWWHTNWLYVYPWELFDSLEDTSLQYLTRTLLGRVAPDVWVPIDEFYDTLIEIGGLKEHTPVSLQDTIHNGLDAMIIYPMRTFEVLEVKKGPRKWRSIMIDRPSAFRITPFGRQLLRTV